MITAVLHVSSCNKIEAIFLAQLLFPGSARREGYSIFVLIASTPIVVFSDTGIAPKIGQITAANRAAVMFSGAASHIHPVYFFRGGLQTSSRSLLCTHTKAKIPHPNQLRRLKTNIKTTTNTASICLVSTWSPSQVDFR
jgi:hypothetical protein